MHRSLFDVKRPNFIKILCAIDNKKYKQIHTQNSECSSCVLFSSRTCFISEPQQSSQTPSYSLFKFVHHVSKLKCVIIIILLLLLRRSQLIFIGSTCVVFLLINENFFVRFAFRFVWCCASTFTLPALQQVIVYRVISLFLKVCPSQCVCCFRHFVVPSKNKKKESAIFKRHMFLGSASARTLMCASCLLLFNGYTFHPSTKNHQQQQQTFFITSIAKVLFASTVVSHYVLSTLVHPSFSFLTTFKHNLFILVCDSIRQKTCIIIDL